MRVLAVITYFGASLVAATRLGGQTLTEAEYLYTQTQFNQSLALLDKNSSDPRTVFLIGRNYLMLGEFKKATQYLEKAATAQPNNSDCLDWLGRAYGKRAETSNPLLAPSFASKSRQAFERSVALNPKNADALSDLFEYYLAAPGFLGGGYDKAEAVVQKIAAIDPPEAYFDRAELDQKRNQLGTAERHLREAVALAPREVGHLIALAKFLAKQGRAEESDAVFREAQSIAPDSPRVWFARADTLVKQKRNLDEARNLLHKYLHAPTTVDDPPKEDALRLLKQVDGA